MAKYRNSNSAKVDIDQVAKVIMNDMRILRDITVEGMENAVNYTAKEVVKELRNAKPEDSEKYGSWDAYRKGWRATRENKKGAFRFDMVVHNKTHYRLAHLLEKGHALVKGGRTRSFKHIRPIEQKAEDMLMDSILHELERNL